MNNIVNQEAPESQTAEQQSSAPIRFVSPEVNIFENADGYFLEADVPGVGKEGLDITVEASTLTLLARRAKVGLTGEPLHRESASADYRRVFELDPAIDSSRISAKIEQGVLTVTLPKSEKVKSRKITVTN